MYNSFNNNLEKYKPKTKRNIWKSILYFLFAIIFIICIPILFAYLEAWEFTFNIENLIWESANPFRLPYFLFFICANMLFVAFLMYSMRNIDSLIIKIRNKKIILIFVFILYIVVLVLYIFAIINK